MLRHRYFYQCKGRRALADPAHMMESSLSWASNFAMAPFELDGKRWPTSEHYYQAAKFAQTDPAYAEAIRTCKTGLYAARMGRVRSHPMSPTWDAEKDDAMRRALMAKFEQNPVMRRKLLDTGSDVLHEDAGTRDLYWGVGTPDHPGRDMLGRLLMEVRARVCAAAEQSQDSD